MTGFQDLEGQLLNAIERGVPRRARVSTAIILAASSAIVVALATVAIVALGHGKPPPPPSRPPVAPAPHGRELSDLNAAMNDAVANDPACRFAPGIPAGPASTEAKPSAKMLSVLGVLRRPASAAERLPPMFYRRGRLRADRIGNDPYVRYIRRARVVNGVSYYIVPLARYGQPAVPAQVRERCISEEMQALRNRLSDASAPRRAATLRAGARFYARLQAARAHGNVREAVVLLAFRNGNGVGGAGGEGPAAIEQQGMLITTGPVVTGVVPSGVDQVELEYRRATAVTDVVGNVFVVKPPRLNGRGEDFSPTMIWHAANGRVIKTVKPPAG